MEWKKLVDKALGTNFDAPVYDPQKGRDKLVRQIDLAAKQHSEGTTRAPNRAWRAGNNEAIRFAAKLDGKPVLLDGDEAVYVPASRFQDFLKHLKASVEAGDLDKDIKAALESNASAGTSSTRAPRATSAKPAGSGEKPWQSRSDWAELTVGDKRSIGKYHSQGKNPDGSLIAEVGHKPDAPIVRSK